MNAKPKIITSELVLSAIFFLQQKNGVTSRDITKFICEKRGYKQKQVREEVKKALERATKKGIFEKKRGLYRIKSAFGKSIISKNVRKLNKNEKQISSGNNESQEATESYRSSFKKKIFHTNSSNRRDSLTIATKLNQNENFQDSCYLGKSEDDFENQSGENISLERLRECKSDDDDFLEDNEYDDDEIDFFADDQFPTPEEALRSAKNSSTEDVKQKDPPSKCKEGNERKQKSHKKKQKLPKSSKIRSKQNRSEKAPEENKNVSPQDDDDDYLDFYFENEGSGKEDKILGSNHSKESLGNDGNERQQKKSGKSKEDRSKNLDSNDQGAKKEEEYDEDEDYSDKSDVSIQKLHLDFNNKYQKIYNSKDLGREKKENTQNYRHSDLASNSPKINTKVETKKSGQCGSVRTSLRSAQPSQLREVLSEPESTEKKSKRERSSSLFRTSQKITTCKRKHTSDSKSVKHRKFN